MNPTTAPTHRARNIMLLTASALTVMAGAGIAAALPGLAKAFVDVPQAEFLSKLALTLPALAITLSAPLMGWLGDITGRRRLLAICAFAFAAAGSSGLWLDSLQSILIGRALLGVAVAGIMTSVAALIAEFFQGPARFRFIGLQSSTAAFGGLIFLTLGGRLADEGWRWPFAVYIAGIPVALACLLFIDAPKVHIDDERIRDTKGGVPADWRIVGVASFLVFLGQIAFYVVPTQVPFFLKEGLGVSGTAIGIALGTSTLFGGLVALTSKRVQSRVGSLASLAISFAAFAVAFAILGIAKSYVVSLFAMVAVGIGMGLLMPGVSVLVMSAVPSAIAGRAIGMMTACLFLGQFLSPLISDPIVKGYGHATAFLITSGAMIVVAIATLAARNRMSSITISPLNRR